MPTEKGVYLIREESINRIFFSNQSEKICQLLRQLLCQVFRINLYWLNLPYLTVWCVLEQVKAIFRVLVSGSQSVTLDPKATAKSEPSSEKSAFPAGKSR